MRIRVHLLFVSLLAVSACSPEPPASGSDGTWVGTITTEGSVTSVVNESGTVWGGAATLVEELSIGVDQGAPHEMLGPARGVWDSGNRIVYPDLSVPVVRVYDGAGNYVGDVGRSGQGPGEYQYPFSAAILTDGRILVTNAESGWIDVFDADRTYLERWGPHPEELTAAGARLHHALIVGPEGMLYLNYYEWPNGEDLRLGWRAIDRDGLGPVIWQPDLEFEPLQNCFRPDCSLYSPVEYAPSAYGRLLPSGEMVAGVNNRYEFSIHHEDGSVTSVRREGVAVGLGDDEWDYWMKRERAQGIARTGDWQPSWSADVPRQKPAFSRIYGAQDGRLFVLRDGPSRRLDDCTEDPLASGSDPFVACWESEPILDVFGADGRYLGAIETPLERLRWPPHVDGSRFTAMVENEAGTIMVKRYRLVLPGEGR